MNFSSSEQVEKVEISKIRDVLDNMYAYIEEHHNEVLKELEDKKAFNKELEDKLGEAIAEFMGRYN